MRRRMAAPVLLAGLLGLSLDPPAADAQAKADAESFMTADGMKLKGLFHRSPNGAKQGDAVVVLMYQPGPEKDMTKGNWDGLVAKLTDAGFHVFRFDWRGHGQSTEIADPLGDNIAIGGVLYNGFWVNRFTGLTNQALIKGFSKTKAPKNVLKVKDDFTPANAARYFPYYVNDLAAVRLHLDLKNDRGDLNSSSIYLVGAGDTAALGLLWLAGEWQRPAVAPMLPAGLQYKLVPTPGIVVDPPAGADIAGAVWLSADYPSPPISVHNLQTWARVSPKLRDTNEMLFLYGATHKEGKDGADTFYKKVLVANGDPKLNLAAVKQTFTFPIPNTKLVGTALLDPALPTEGKVMEYLGERQKARVNLIRKNRNYVAPYYVDVTHYMK